MLVTQLSLSMTLFSDLTQKKEELLIPKWLLFGTKSVVAGFCTMK